MPDAGTQSQQMPRQEDDLLRRVKVLEQLVQQTQSAAAGAQAVGTQLSSLISQQTALLANQVSPAASAATGTITWGTSYSTAASFNFVVPTGYTRAVIMATGGTWCFSSTSDLFYAQTLINGNAGTESHAVGNGPFISASHALTITGLSGGASIPVSFQAHLVNGPGNSNSANITGIALYLK